MLKRDDGFTLIELIVAMALAMIISLAAFSLIDIVMKRTGEVGARVETTQRARGALDDMTRSLRSQVCVIRSDGTAMTTARSIYTASATQIVFFADTADESWKSGVTTLPVPTLRTLTFTPAAGAKGTITETVRPGVDDTSNPGLDAVTFAATAGERIRTVLTNIEQLPDPADGTKLLPVFRYFTYTTPAVTNPPTIPTLTKELLPGTGSLSATEVASIAKITVAYRVRAFGKVTQKVSATLQGDVFTRTVDPNATNPKPTCL